MRDHFKFAIVVCLVLISLERAFTLIWPFQCYYQPSIIEVQRRKELTSKIQVGFSFCYQLHNYVMGNQYNQCFSSLKNFKYINKKFIYIVESINTAAQQLIRCRGIAPSKGIRISETGKFLPVESGILEIFACGIHAETWTLEPRIQL